MSVDVWHEIARTRGITRAQAKQQLFPQVYSISTEEKDVSKVIAVNNTSPTKHQINFIYLAICEGYLSEETKQSPFVSIGECCVIDEGVKEVLRWNGSCFAV